MTAPGQHPLFSVQARAAVPAAARLSVRLVYLVSALSIVLLVAADLAIAHLLRDSTLRSAEKTLADKAFILAEGAERTMQAADLVLGGVARHAVSDGADSPESFDAVMSTQNANTMLRDQMTGLPQLNALLVVSLSGHLENSTRYWPVPPIDIRDRGYFQKMMADPALDMMITEPLSARGDGTWTMFLVRRARGPSGHPIGLLMAAIELKYFEGFYRSFTRVGEGSTVLLTADGTMLARYPPMTGAVTGRRFADVPRILGDAGAGTAREPSAVDGSMRVKAARSLKTYPMIVLTIADEALLLRDWRRIILVLGLGTAAAAVEAMAVSLLIARRWRHHDALSQERENRALAEAALMREREHSAEAESRAKSDFLAMMSHEIRTPMNGVLGVAGTLLETPLSAQQRKMVTLIRDSGDSLLTILNDILDYSKLNADKMQIGRAHV